MKWFIDQKLNNCTPTSLDENYIVTCANGTDRTNTSIKIYLMTIKNISAMDANIWWCELTESGARSKTLSLEVRSKTLSFTIPYL